MAAFQDENDHVNQITFAAQVSVLSFSYTTSHYLSFVKKYRASEDLLSCLQGRITKQKQQKKETLIGLLPHFPKFTSLPLIEENKTTKTQPDKTHNRPDSDLV